MILVTLGTQDKGFERLLAAIQDAIDHGQITQEVVVQAGLTKFESADMKIFDFIPMDQFDDLMKEADLLITHGGVGSISTGVKLKKAVIAAPRLKEFGEHTNDHQVEIVKKFSKDGCLLPLWKMEDLPKLLEEARSFTPNPLASNTPKFIKLIEEYLDSLE